MNDDATLLLMEMEHIARKLRELHINVSIVIEHE